MRIHNKQSSVVVGILTTASIIGSLANDILNLIFRLKKLWPFVLYMSLVVRQAIQERWPKNSAARAQQ